MTSFRLGAALVAAATLLTTVFTGTASATDSTANNHRVFATLTLTIEVPQGDFTTVRLRCHPTGGTHPSPWRACRELTMADGDFDNLPGSPELIACTMEYRPVIAYARGVWNGQFVRWHHKYSNPCVLLSATGVVFDF
jgi:hypothetical protein